jgi:hypothetical protein
MNISQFSIVRNETYIGAPSDRWGCFPGLRAFVGCNGEVADGIDGTMTPET